MSVTGTGTTGSFTYTGVEAFGRSDTNFSRYTAGALGVGWTRQFAAGDPTAEVKDDVFGGKVHEYDLGGSNDEYWHTFNVADGVSDAEMLIKFRVTGTLANGQFRAIARQGGTNPSRTGYAFYVDTGQYGFFKLVSGTFNFIGSATTFSPVAGTWYWARVNITGTALKAKLWADGDSEPGSWDVDETDSAIASGNWGTGVFSTTPVTDIDYFAIVPDGEETEVPEISLPTTAETLFNSTHEEDDTKRDWGFSQEQSSDALSRVTDGGALGGSFLRVTRTAGSGISGWTWIPSINTYDHQLYAKFKQESLSDDLLPAFWIHGDMRDGIEEGYYVEVQDDGDILLIEKTGVSTLTTLDSANKSRTAGTWYRIRAEAVDGTVRARIWEDGTAEPGTWDVSAADTTFKGGHIAIGVNSVASETATFDIDFLHGGFQSNAAPEPPVGEATTPSITYSAVTPTAVLGATIVQATTPQFTFTGVDGTRRTLGTITFVGVDGEGSTAQVRIQIDSPNHVYEYNSVDVDVTTSDLTGLGVLSFETKILYDHTKITAASVSPKGVTLGKPLTVNLNTPGEIIVVFADTVALTGSGDLFEITFDADINVDSPNQLIDLTFDSFLFNEGTPTSSVMAGTVLVSDNLTVTPSFSFVGVDANPTGIASTPFFTFTGVDGHPASTANLGYGIPATFTFEGVVPSSTLGNISVGITTPQITLTAQAATGSVATTTGLGQTGVFSFVGVSAGRILGSLATTPIMTFVGVDATDETFGTPTRLKGEIFPKYAVKLIVRSRVDGSPIDKAEPAFVRAKILDEFGSDQILDNVAVYVLLKDPNGAITGPFEMTAMGSAVYEYDFNPAERGEWWARVQTARPDFIEEKKFAVRNTVFD